MSDTAISAASAPAAPKVTVQIVSQEMPQGFAIPADGFDFTEQCGGSVNEAINAFARGGVESPPKVVFVRSSRLSKETGRDVIYKISLVEHPAEIPPGWEKANGVDPTTKREYFINHDLRRTAWTVGKVPPPFVAESDPYGRTCFRKVPQDANRTSAAVYSDPRLGALAPATPPPAYVPRVRVHPKAVPDSDIDGEAPPMYADTVAHTSLPRVSAKPVAQHASARLSREHLSSFTLPEMTEEEMIARAQQESLETFRKGSLRQMSVRIRESLQQSLSGPIEADATTPRHSVELEQAGLENMAKTWMDQSADSGLDVDPTLYARYQTEESADDEQIRRDIGRTFADLKVFQSVEGQERLFRVLHAFSCACSDPSCINNEELGYVQGMNFLAGFLIIMCGNQEADEEAAFWLLVRLMMSRKYRIAGMFMEGMSGVFCAAEQVERGMDKLMPDIKKALEDAMIPTTAWLPQWILTLFAKQMGLIGPAAVQQIWNNIFKEGWPAIIKTALAILEASRDQIVGGAFDTLLVFLMDGVWTKVDFFTVAFRASEMELPAQLLEEAELAFVIRQDEEEQQQRELLQQRLEQESKEQVESTSEADSRPKRGPTTIDTIIDTVKKGIEGLVGKKKASPSKKNAPASKAGDSAANSPGLDSWEDVSSDVPEAIVQEAQSSGALPITNEAGARVSLQAESSQMENYLYGRRVKFLNANGRVLQTSLLGTATFSKSINNWSTWEVEQNPTGSGVFLRNKAGGNWLAIDSKRMRPCCRMLQARASAFHIRINSDGRVSLESVDHRGFFLAATTDASAIISSVHNVGILLELTVLKS